jgi:hypothetical protein
LVTSLQRTFNAHYPEARLQNLHVSIEYPIKPQDYPSIWVDFEESLVQNAGIDHAERDEEGNLILRWRYEGNVSYTIAALSSLERDRIYDELVKVLAFSRSADHLNAFREFVENNDFIAMNFDFDQIEVHGNAATPGTPWETDEIIYERTLVMQVLGEFTTDVDTGDLVPLSRIIIDAREAGSTEADPTGPLHWDIEHNFVPPGAAPGGVDADGWH